MYARVRARGCQLRPLCISCRDAEERSVGLLGGALARCAPKDLRPPFCFFATLSDRGQRRDCLRRSRGGRAAADRFASAVLCGGLKASHRVYNGAPPIENPMETFQHVHPAPLAVVCVSGCVLSFSLTRASRKAKRSMFKTSTMADNS